MRSKLPTLLTLVVVLGACTGDDPAAGPSPAARPAETATAAVLTDEEARVDDALVDAQIAWLLSVAADPETATLDEAAYAERFTERFRSQVPVADLVGVLEGLAAVGPLEITREVSRSPYGELVLTAAAADGSELVLTLAISPQGQIGGLLVSPGAPPQLSTPVGTLHEAAEQLAALGQAGLSAGPVEAGSCTSAVAVAADQPAPVAAAAVLFVLGAVVDAVEAGGLRWDTPLVLGEADRSLRSPVLQLRDTPSRLDVEEVAELAVLTSDHTAIDLLIRAVGRSEVERAQARWGHATPQVNTPFPTTGEVFRLKAADEAVQQRWQEGDEAARRAVLDELAGTDLPAAEWFEDGPVAPAIGWSAAPSDLCRAMARLLDAADRPGLEPLEGILTGSRGVPDTAGRWDRIAFVGGGEAGVLSAVWVVEADGERQALAATLLDPAAAFDEVQTILLLGAARDLLGTG